MRRRGGSSDVEVTDVEGVVFDEGAARFDDIAHEDGEHAVGFDHVFLIEFDLKELAAFRVHGGVVELFGVHFTEALEAIDFETAAADFEDALEDFGDGEERVLTAVVFEEFEERFILSGELVEGEPFFAELDEDFANGAGLVDFVETGAALGETGVGARRVCGVGDRRDSRPWFPRCRCGP